MSRSKQVESVKLENVTRLVNHTKCCAGYQISDQKTCRPVCDQPCENGVCIEPNVCSCYPRFTGSKCESYHCPSGNWGPDCAYKCKCADGEKCEANTGNCEPAIGSCKAGTFGPGCSQNCSCNSNGTALCYHLNGYFTNFNFSVFYTNDCLTSQSSRYIIIWLFFA